MGKIRNGNEGRKGNPFLTSLTLLAVMLPALFLMSGQAEAAGPFGTWNGVIPSPTTSLVKAITYGDGKLVAVGGSKIFTSTNWVNGSSWATTDLGSGINLNAVTYGKGMFVAVGDYPNSVFTSSDGYTWTQRDSGTVCNLKAVAYGNGKFIAVGDTGSGTATARSSSDGISWALEQGVTGSGITYNGITHAANMFVIVGKWFFSGPEATAMALVKFDTPTNGYTNTNWYITEMSPSTIVAPEAVTYGNGYFVAVAPGKVFTSTDGVHFGHQDTLYNLRGIANGYLIFVAVGDGGTLVTFSDPTNPATWTSQGSGTSNNLSGVNLGGDTRFFVVGAGTILYSGPFGIDLAVTKPGTGTGTVRSLPPGINCGSDCDEHYDSGTVVTLTAVPDTGSYFAGWSDGTNTSQALTWKVTMGAAKNVTATFNSGAPAVTTWAKTFGTPYGSGQYVEQTSDGGYIVAGSSQGASAPEIWVLKLNPDGTAAWNTRYGGQYGSWPYSIQQTSDGGYIVAGTTLSYGKGSYDVWVLKLDESGTVVWQKTYGDTGDDRAYSVQQTSDGGYIVAGRTNSFGASGGDAWILKLDPNGNVVWQNTYGGTGGDEADTIQQTTDGGYIVAGQTLSFGVGQNDAWILKLDANGNVEWQKHYGNAYHQYAYFVRQTSDGGYIVAGDDDSSGLGNYKYHFWVMKLDGSGNVSWQKTYAGSTATDSAWSIQQTTDGGYIVAGQYNTGGTVGTTIDIWVLKLDASGNVVWQKAYDTTGNDYAYSIQQTSDGGYVVGGWTDYSVGTVLVLKLDSDGNIFGCQGGLTITGTNASVSSPTITVADTNAAPANTGVLPQTSSANNSIHSLPVSNAVCSGIQSFALTMVVSGTGSISLSPPGGTYSADTVVTLTANPAVGSHFDHWEGDATGTNNPTTVTMDANKTVTAVFVLDTFTVTATVAGASAGGSVTAPLSETVNYNDSATFTVTTNLGYWASVSGGTLSGTTGTITWTIPNVMSTYTASVTFNPIISGTVTDGGTPPAGISGVTMGGFPNSTVTISDGSYSASVPYGWSGTVTPILAGYNFNPSSSLYTNVQVPVTQNYTATLQTFTISGYVTDTSNNPIYGVSLSGLPTNPITDNTGYYSDSTVPYGWSGTVSPTNPAYTFAPGSIPYTNVQSNQLNQNYTGTIKSFTIMGTAQAGGGTVTCNPTTVNYNGSSHCVMTPNEFYGLAALTVDGTPKTPPPSVYDFSSITDNHTITATFGVLHTITATVDGAGGTLTPSGFVLVPDGGSQQFNIVPNSGYYTQAVFVDGVSQSSIPTQCTFTNVTTDRSIEAIFAFGSAGTPPPPVITPNAPTASGATCVETTSPTLSWSCSNCGNTYVLQVSSDNFATFVFNGTVNGTSQALSGLSYYTVYSWKVQATGGPWSEVYSFNVEPAYGCLFKFALGTLDPTDTDGDGIDDTTEAMLGTDPNHKTLFIRPKMETATLGVYNPGGDYFISLFPFLPGNPYGIQPGDGGRAYIPAFAAAGIEVVVIGFNANDSTRHTVYTQFNDINYDPAADPNHPPIDILDIIIKRPTSYYSGSTTNKGHTYFYASAPSGPNWFWDTFGYTPHSLSIYGYYTPSYYPFPLTNYFMEGAYNSIAPPPQNATYTSCSISPCTGYYSPNALIGNPPYSRPDGSAVQFNQVTYNAANAQITNIGSRGTNYSQTQVEARAIVHEIGHALLSGSDNDHCVAPDCVMYQYTKDWEPWGYGSANGTCPHQPNGSMDIRSRVHNTRHTPQPPVLITPTVTNTTPTLSWKPSVGATSYDLQVSTSSAFSSIAFSATGIAGTSQQVTSGLSRNTTYYWQVRGDNAVGTGNWSSYQSFKTPK